MTKDRAVYIRHIFDCINRVKEYVRPGKENFFRDRKTQDAATRNFLAHQYLGVDLALVWNIVELHLPRLENQIIEIARDEGIDLDDESNPPAMPA